MLVDCDAGSGYLKTHKKHEPIIYNAATRNSMIELNLRPLPGDNFTAGMGPLSSKSTSLAASRGVTEREGKKGRRLCRQVSGLSGQRRRGNRSMGRGLECRSTRQ